jgi:hypothetical protein
MNQLVLTERGTVTYCKGTLTDDTGNKIFVCLSGLFNSVKPLDEKSYIETGRVKTL